MARRVRTTKRSILLFVLAPILAGSAVLGVGAQSQTVEKTPSGSASTSATSEPVLAPLQRTLAWYQGARLAMQSIGNALDADFTRGEQQTAQRVLQRAFDTARARAALAERAGPTENADAQSRQSRAARAAQLKASVAREEQGITELRTRLRAATPVERAAIERQLAVANNRLELGRARLDFMTKLGQVEATVSDDDVDLAEQIRALQDAVPELSATDAQTTVVTTAPQAAPWSAGARTLLYRLLALQRNRRVSTELAQSTAALARDTRGELRDTQQAARPMVARLEALATTPATDSASLKAGQAEFRDLLDRTKLSGTVVLSLREETALLERFGTDVQAWTRTLDREIGHVLRGLALELVGVASKLRCRSLPRSPSRTAMSMRA